MSAASIPPDSIDGAQAARPSVARWSVAAWVLLFWFGFYGLMMPSDMIEDMQMAHGANLARDVFGTFLQASVWSLLSPLILWLTQHYAIEGPLRWRNIGIHAGAGLAISAVNVAICHSLVYAVFGDRIGSSVHWTLGESVLVSTPYMVIIYLAFAAIVYSIRLVRRYEEREKLLAQAQVQALKAQLNPHFLYNTLNAVSEFAYKDAATAERLITMLSDLLRLSFAGGDAPKVPLADELAFVRRYLDIQQLLLEDRLQVRYAFEPEALGAQVPNFILQPLVENAVVHGISRRVATGHIEVGARVENGRLKLWVSDDGPGLAGASPRRHGIGLSHTRARLTQLYGGEQGLEIDSPAAGGFNARLCLPYERQRTG
ncbi:sensor histidine kinase [Nevskia soli]|uniref:sensor histidine kinase n=1 Tax=Nevskia soli TaxID=418856 RepID=UPI00146FD318|nr:histidine kinase [Nevskia soli]